MESSTVQRRLAAILAADVVGYGRLMSVDEIATLEALKAHRRELIDPAIAAHHGRIVKTTGDGALVEFASVVDAEAMLTLMRLGWGQENPAFRQLFTSQFIPGATKEQADWFNELQRISISPESAVRYRIATGDFDVSALPPQVRVPTLVMHARDDAVVPFDQGRRLAAGIPGARFVPLPSRNHLVLEDEPAFPRFLHEMRAFLAA
jgi:pimeloyl-ACP methyl ester carboxylesterase